MQTIYVAVHISLFIDRDWSMFRPVLSVHYLRISATIYESDPRAIFPTFAIIHVAYSDFSEIHNHESLSATIRSNNINCIKNCKVNCYFKRRVAMKREN